MSPQQPDAADDAGRVAVHGAAARRTGDGTWVTADPAGPGGQFMLNAVAVAAADLVWAVGQVAGGVLIESWDGMSWKNGPTPTLAPELHGAVLQGVAAEGRDSAIAVGGAFNRLTITESPLAYHWDGMVWRELTLPDLGIGYTLTDVALASDDEAWAVGSTGKPLILHWDGSEWRQAELPDLGEGRLTAIAATPSALWAVGVAGNGAARRPLVLRGDGRHWAEVPCPIKPKLLPRGLSSLAVGPDGQEVWAGGGDSVLRWDGTRWKRYESGLAAVNAVTVSPKGEVWAAGAQGGLGVLDEGEKGFREVALGGSQALWLGIAADDESVWLVGSRQGRSEDGERSGVANERARHLVSE